MKGEKFEKEKKLIYKSKLLEIYDNGKRIIKFGVFKDISKDDVKKVIEEFQMRKVNPENFKPHLFEHIDQWWFGEDKKPYIKQILKDPEFLAYHTGDLCSYGLPVDIFIFYSPKLKLCVIASL